MSTTIPDPSTPFGQHVAQRLREDLIAWLTTVDARGTPQPNPVWFLWDGATFLVYNLSDAKRLAHIQANARVSLNLNSTATGGDLVVITGEAHLTSDESPADQVPEYVEKYRERIAQSFGTPAEFARRYPVALRITPTRLRGR
ncbi:MAG TPA: TIGR03667 family PPOX class F420-dependent oxidoreductase [Ktedonobacterales bacterium]|jgi:PPOX class probable F420-dependent enzyme